MFRIRGRGRPGSEMGVVADMHASIWPGSRLLSRVESPRSGRAWTVADGTSDRAISPGTCRRIGCAVHAAATSDSQPGDDGREILASWDRGCRSARARRAVRTVRSSRSPNYHRRDPGQPQERTACSCRCMHAMLRVHQCALRRSDQEEHKWCNRSNERRRPVRGQTGIATSGSGTRSPGAATRWTVTRADARGASMCAMGRSSARSRGQPARHRAGRARHEPDGVPEGAPRGATCTTRPTASRIR